MRQQAVRSSSARLAERVRGDHSGAKEPGGARQGAGVRKLKLASSPRHPSTLASARCSWRASGAKSVRWRRARQSQTLRYAGADRGSHRSALAHGSTFSKRARLSMVLSSSSLLLLSLSPLLRPSRWILVVVARLESSSNAARQEDVALLEDTLLHLSDLSGGDGVESCSITCAC